MFIPSVFRVLSRTWGSWSHEVIHLSYQQSPPCSPDTMSCESHDIKTGWAVLAWYVIKGVCHLLHMKFRTMQCRVSTAAQWHPRSPGSVHLPALLPYLLFGFASLHCHMVTRWLPQPHTSCPRSRDLCQNRTRRTRKARKGVSHYKNLFFYLVYRGLRGAFPVRSHQITWPALFAKQAGKRSTCTDTTGLHPLPKLKVGGSVSKDRALWWLCRHQW